MNDANDLVNGAWRKRTKDLEHGMRVLLHAQLTAFEEATKHDSKYRDSGPYVLVMLAIEMFRRLDIRDPENQPIPQYPPTFALLMPVIGAMLDACEKEVARCD